MKGSYFPVIPISFILFPIASYVAPWFHENNFTFKLFCILQSICFILVVNESTYYCFGFFWILTSLFFLYSVCFVLLQCVSAISSFSLTIDLTSCSHLSYVSFSFSFILSILRLFLRYQSSK